MDAGGVRQPRGRTQKGASHRPGVPVAACTVAVRRDGLWRRAVLATETADRELSRLVREEIALASLVTR